MLTVETALRLIVIGQELLVALVFLFGNGTRATRISGAMLMLSVAAYLFTSDPGLRGSTGILLPVVALLAMSVPYCLWAFARAIFESSWPNRWLVSVALLVGISVWVTFVLTDYDVGERAASANLVMHVMSLVIVLHAIWITARGRLDDLLEHRRKYRLFFVVIVAAQVLLVLVVELALGTASPPSWLALGNVAIIALMTLGLAVPMLRLDPDLVGIDERSVDKSELKNERVLSAADSVLQAALLALMDDGYHQETGLMIRTLAEKLRHPEHQLRRLINGHLQYRNFSAFLNSYRIAAAKRQLADAERVRVPVLTIALELGYASLGPFNRAFKAETGTTPSEYRQRVLIQRAADSE